MNNYFIIIKHHTLPLIISFGLIIWGISNYGVFKVIFGIVILIPTVHSIYKEFNYLKTYKNWLKLNEGVLVLFYPSKKSIQDIFATEINPQLKFKFLTVYYDGANLRGDIKTQIIIELFKWNKDLNINNPSIFIIKKQEIIIELIKDVRISTNKEENLNIIEDIKNFYLKN